MIGGEHYFPVPTYVENSMVKMLQETIGVTSYFSTGRDALFSLLVSLPNKNIILPDLICQSVYEASISANKIINFYNVEYNLKPKNIAINKPADQTCILVMHYFGIVNQDLMIEAKRAGIIVISDVTHLLFNSQALSLIADLSDYLVASLRKSGAFPDGGFVSSKKEQVTQAQKPIREDFFALRVSGLFARGFSAKENFVNDENHKLLTKAETILDSSPADSHCCSYTSQLLLSCIDIKHSQTQIQLNIAILKHHLSNNLIVTDNSATISPYFYCFFRTKKERDEIRKNLAKHQYFCPIHWDTSWSHHPSFLSDIIFSIPCDARYNENDMNTIAREILICM